MIYILYSNDYEVCLGGNYRPETEVLIETTDRVLSVCGEIGVPMTLFCDVLCLWRYRELGYTEFPDSVDDQLRRTIQRGHDVQAHIHPHWLETDIAVNTDGSSQYQFDLSTFLLGNWSGKKGMEFQPFLVDILSKARSYLTELLTPVAQDYCCVAQRAGGYGIQPKSKEIFAALTEAGFAIDSSVVPGMVLHSNVNRINLADVPHKGNYHIQPELGLERASNVGVFEVPVLALRNSAGRRLLLETFPRRAIKMLRSLRQKSVPKPLGYSIQSTEARGKCRSLVDTILNELNFIRRGWWMLELIPDAPMMVDATRDYIEQYGRDQQDLYFALSCHSKRAYPDKLNALKAYHRSLTDLYGKRFKAITFQQAFHNLNKRLEGSECRKKSIRY